MIMNNYFGTLVISPHSDDLSFSMAQLLSKGLFLKPLHVVTIFSLSFHVSYHLRVWFFSAFTPFVRILEDLKFCRTIGVKFHMLGLYDRITQNGDSLYKHFLIFKVKQKLLKLIDRLKVSIVVCPCPNNKGDNKVHPHHEIVFKAVTSTVASLPQVELWLVDDQPYSRLSINSEIIFNNVSYVPTIVELSERDLIRKIKLMFLYKSQMKKSYLESVLKPAPGDYQNRFSETLWMPSSFVMAK
jgi:LmbE family N-acetylglucosaminyl deacetylase